MASDLDRVAIRETTRADKNIDAKIAVTGRRILGAERGAQPAIRSITAGKSAPAPSGTATPYADTSRAPASARADRSNALEGTQPVLRQSPPIRSRSINATFAPRPAAPAAIINPAVPAPITTML